MRECHYRRPLQLVILLVSPPYLSASALTKLAWQGVHATAEKHTACKIIHSSNGDRKALVSSAFGSKLRHQHQDKAHMTCASFFAAGSLLAYMSAAGPAKMCTRPVKWKRSGARYVASRVVSKTALVVAARCRPIGATHDLASVHFPRFRRCVV